MLVNVGTYQMATLIHTDMDYGQAGTGTKPAQITDTALQNPESDTKNALSTKTKSKNAVTVTHSVLLAEANGKNLSEWEVRGNTDTDSFNRYVSTPFGKTSTNQIEFIHTFTVETK